MELHWYCFSYIGKDIKTGLTANGCTYSGYTEEGVTLQAITENKQNAGVTDDAVLISVSYLGKMTKEVFTGKSKNEKQN